MPFVFLHTGPQYSTNPIKLALKARPDEAHVTGDSKVDLQGLPVEETAQLTPELRAELFTEGDPSLEQVESVAEEAESGIVCAARFFYADRLLRRGPETGMPCPDAGQGE